MTYPASLAAPLPRFTDAQRRDKLATAFPAVRAAFEQYAAEQHIPGLALGLVLDGELIYADAFGTRDAASSAPVTPDSVFRIASMSKSFVALAILQLRDGGLLRLDDPVHKYIPQLKRLVYPTTDSPVLTLRHLLTMSAGFPEDNPWGDRQMAISERTFSRWLRAGIPFSNAPDETFEYSNYGYSLLGRIITRVSRVPFQQYIADHILAPLGMSSTTWDRDRVPPDRLASGHRWEDDAHSTEPLLPDGAFAAMAGLFSTVPDFCRYMSFLLDAFPPRDAPDDDPLRRSSRREMQQLARFEELVQRSLPSGETWSAVAGYGYGLAIWHDSRFGYGVSHGGGLPGFGSYYYILPHHCLGLVALANKTYARVGFVFPQVLDLLARTGGLNPRTLGPSPVLAALVAVVNRWLAGGDDAELVANAADNFFLDRDLAHRRAELESLRADLGPIQSFGELETLNALRGRWQLQCERGRLTVLLSLSPTLPPLLQMLTLTPIPNS